MLSIYYKVWEDGMVLNCVGCVALIVTDGLCIIWMKMTVIRTLPLQKTGSQTHYEYWL